MNTLRTAFANYNNYSNNNKPTFKGAYCVKIPYSSLENVKPEEIRTSLKDFDMFDYKNIFSNRDSKKIKALTFREKPSVCITTTGMKQNKINYSFNWFKQNSNLPIADITDKNSYSLYIYTKENKDNICKTIRHFPVKLCKYAYEAVMKYFDDYALQYTYTMAKFGTELDKAGGQIDKTFELEKIGDIKNIMKEMDI